MTGLDRWLPPNGNTYREELPKLPKPPTDNMNTPMTVTAKTAKTPGTEVVSVLAVGGIGISVYGEQDFHRIAEMQWERVAQLVPHAVHNTLAEAWPSLYQRIKAADTELNGLWATARRDGNFPDNLPAFKAACRTWCRLNIEAARYVRYLDRGIKRVYSRKLGEWVYIVKDKAAVHCVRLKPRGAVYTVDEAKALLEANPGPEELRALHRAKTAFQGELSAGS